MRALGFLLGVVACSSPPPAVPARPPAPPDAPPKDTTWAADPDGDDILGACDQCPAVKETSRRIHAHNPDDGCPETPEEIERVAADPRVQYGAPLYLTGGGTTISGPWQIAEEIETLACIGVGADEVIAKRRADTLCSSVEQALKAVNSNVKTERHTRVLSNTNQYILQVMRASGVDIYKWTTDLERVTPRPIVGKPVIEGCERQGFYTNSFDNIGTCSLEGCKGITHVSFVARWPDARNLRTLPPGKPRPPRLE